MPAGLDQRNDAPLAREQRIEHSRRVARRDRRFQHLLRERHGGTSIQIDSSPAEISRFIRVEVAANRVVGKLPVLERPRIKRQAKPVCEGGDAAGW